MNWGLIASLFGESALLIHVSSSDKFNPQIEPQFFRGFNLKRDHFEHSLQILLVPIHYDDLVSSVEAVSQLMSDRIEASLHVGLLGINV